MATPRLTLNKTTSPQNHSLHVLAKKNCCKDYEALSKDTKTNVLRAFKYVVVRLKALLTGKSFPTFELPCFPRTSNTLCLSTCFTWLTALHLLCPFLPPLLCTCSKLTLMISRARNSCRPLANFQPFCPFVRPKHNIFAGHYVFAIRVCFLPGNCGLQPRFMKRKT